MANLHYFTVVENFDKDTFCKQVSALLEDKWELKGDPTFIPRLDKDGNPFVGFYVQALHKIESNPADRRHVKFGS